MHYLRVTFQHTNKCLCVKANLVQLESVAVALQVAL